MYMPSRCNKCWCVIEKYTDDYCKKCNIKIKIAIKKEDIKQKQKEVKQQYKDIKMLEKKLLDFNLN